MSRLHKARLSVGKRTRSRPARSSLRFVSLSPPRSVGNLAYAVSRRQEAVGTRTRGHSHEATHSISRSARCCDNHDGLIRGLGRRNDHDARLLRRHRLGSRHLLFGGAAGRPQHLRNPHVLQPGDRNGGAQARDLLVGERRWTYLDLHAARRRQVPRRLRLERGGRQGKPGPGQGDGQGCRLYLGLGFRDNRYRHAYADDHHHLPRAAQSHRQRPVCVHHGLTGRPGAGHGLVHGRKRGGHRTGPDGAMGKVPAGGAGKVR